MVKIIHGKSELLKTLLLKDRQTTRSNKKTARHLSMHSKVCSSPDLISLFQEPYVVRKAG